ncbi:MAG: DNA photolyase family protein [Phycisphaeraceae bacterium]|nr:DNA photolyase family protein [Phycisphaeraceae bacterium]
MQTTIHWFRNDLRLADNPALKHAAAQGAVVPVFIWHPDEHGTWQPGGASRWWLHESLAGLSTSLEAIGSRLILRQGDPLDVLKNIAKAAKADAVVWNRRYEPDLIESDKRVKRGLAEADIEVKSFNGALLFEPWEAQTKQGNPYQVYSPFRRFVEALPEPDKPMAAPKLLKSPWKWPASDKIDDLPLMPSIKWYNGMTDEWQPGEAGAAKRLKGFTKAPIEAYKDARDYPSVEATSKLSPHLHFGEASPRQAYHAARKKLKGASGSSEKDNITHFINEVLWREFGYHLIYHFPKTPDHPLREKYAGFPWVDPRKNGGRAALAAWKEGQTGYPIIDAGMRQLWHTGWMHNRVRMVVASFLVKHLLISWHEGAKWFWDTLVDADLASNTLGWQWAGGCGADAAPYFRIFNPITQGEKFDADGAYVKKWCPELKEVPTKYIHKPWECPPLELQAAGVTLGEDYPAPIIDHKAARERALAALSEVTGS